MDSKKTITKVSINLENRTLVAQTDDGEILKWPLSSSGGAVLKWTKVSMGGLLIQSLFKMLQSQYERGDRF